MPESGLHQCQNGCYQVCSECLPQNSKCEECKEYCIITSKVATDVLEIINKHESKTKRFGTISSMLRKMLEKCEENGKMIMIILFLILNY